MKATPLAIPDVILIKPKGLRDEHGFFLESFNQETFKADIGRQSAFSQENHTHSDKNELRNPHYQIQQTQGKLARVVQEEVFDVVEFLYKTTNYYAPSHKRLVLWKDATLAIQWPAGIQPNLSAKDAQGKLYIEAEVFA